MTDFIEKKVGAKELEGLIEKLEAEAEALHDIGNSFGAFKVEEEIAALKKEVMEGTEV